MKFITLFIATIISTSIFMGALSCSDARKAQQGYKKFIKFGGKINCDNDTIWKKDTTYLAGKMIVDSFPIPCNCPALEMPKTIRELKIELRYDLKRQKERDAFVIDSMNKVNKLAKIETKQIKSDNKLKGKEIRIEKKGGFWYNVRFIGIIVLLILLIIISFKIFK